MVCTLYREFPSPGPVKADTASRKEVVKPCQHSPFSVRQAALHPTHMPRAKPLRLGSNEELSPGQAK